MSLGECGTKSKGNGPALAKLPDTCNLAQLRCGRFGNSACYVITLSPTKVTLIGLAFAFGQASALNRDFGTRLGQSTARRKKECIPYLPLDRHVGMLAPRCVENSSDVTRGVQLAADPLNVVAYLHAAMRCLSCAACLDAAIWDVVRAYPCPRLHRPGHPPLDSRCCPCVARADEATICGTPSGEAGG